MWIVVTSSAPVVKGSKVIVETRGTDVVLTLGCPSEDIAKEVCMEIHLQIVAGEVVLGFTNTEILRAELDA